MSAAWLIEPLDQQRHDRSGFDCGNGPLNRYLREQATQDERRLIARCFVACSESDRAVGGFYTLAAAELPLTAIPPDLARKLPRYPTLPAVRIGRLAVDLGHRGKGLGAALVANAIAQSLRSEVAAYALVVDAKDETAVSFYRHFGFLAAGPSDRHLFLPFATAKRAMT